MRQLSILHVEDDDAAALLVQVALQEALPDVRYRRASDVDNALTLLSANTKDPAISAPGLILLDLNLRRKSGFEMLKALRESPHLARLCVVVFTSSAAAADRKIALELGASAYLTKPSIFDDYVIAMHEIVKFAEH